MKALKFGGSGSEYFKIWIVNIFLTLITLGLYYPWAKVRNNRYFYANTTLEQRKFEYHATGKQLFVGYLIGMVLLIAYLIIQSVSPTGSIVVVLGLFIGLPWIIWRSLMFSMRMTSFSNVRFGFKGELGGAYVNYMGLPFVALLSFYLVLIFIGVMYAYGYSLLGDQLGMALHVLVLIIAIFLIALSVFVYAYQRRRNAEYTVGGAHYGQGLFTTDFQTKEFFKITVKTMLVSLFVSTLVFMMIGLTVMLLGMGDDFLNIASSIEDPEALESAFSASTFGVIGFVYFGLIVAGLIAFSYSYARRRKYVYANTVLDEKIKFSSTLSARSLAWVTVTNLLMILVTLGLATPWARVRATKLIAENTLVDTSVGFDDYLTQKEEKQSSIGDQIGDAFDIDVGIGI